MVFVVLAHILIALALLRAFFVGRGAVLRTAGFTLPLSGLVVADAVGWSWTKLLPLILTAAALFLPGGRPLRELPGRGWLMLLGLWSLLVTIWFRVVDYELIGLMEVGRQYGWGPAQVEYRHVVQLFVEVGNWLIFAAAFRLAPTRADGEAATDGFIAGNVLSVVVGMYQTVAIGLDLPWLDREDGRIMSGHLGLGDRGAPLSVGGLQVARLFGLGGEPKHTAALAVMAIALLLARDLDGNRGRFDRLFFGILLIGVALTLSTSGGVALVALCGLLTFIAFRSAATVAARRLLRLGINVLVGFAVLSSLTAFLADEQREGLVETKVVDRLSSLERIAHYEPKDAAALAFLADHPLRLVTGSGVGGADFFSIKYNTRVDIGPGAMITPTYLSVRTLSELGVIGIVLLVGTLFAIRRGASGMSGAAISALGLITLGQPMITFPAFLFLAGSVLGWSAQARAVAVAVPDRRMPSRLNPQETTS